MLRARVLSVAPAGAPYPPPWCVRPGPAGAADHDEFLHWSDDTVVWSAGTSPAAVPSSLPVASSTPASRGLPASPASSAPDAAAPPAVIKVFHAAGAPVQQALWCRFPTDSLSVPVGSLAAAATAPAPPLSPPATVCVVQPTCLTLYAPCGSVYSVPVPFGVERVHPLGPDGGLLVVRRVPPVSADPASAPSSPLAPQLHLPEPLLFSLSHPLEELKPVVFAPLAAGPNFVDELLLEVVALPASALAAILYSPASGRHRVCLIKEHPPAPLPPLPPLNLPATSPLLAAAPPPALSPLPPAAAAAILSPSSAAAAATAVAGRAGTAAAAAVAEPISAVEQPSLYLSPAFFLESCWEATLARPQPAQCSFALQDVDGSILLCMHHAADATLQGLRLSAAADTAASEPLQLAPAFVLPAAAAVPLHALARPAHRPLPAAPASNMLVLSDKGRLGLYCGAQRLATVQLPGSPPPAVLHLHAPANSRTSLVLADGSLLRVALDCAPASAALEACLAGLAAAAARPAADCGCGAAPALLMHILRTLLPLRDADSQEWPAFAQAVLTLVRGDAALADLGDDEGDAVGSAADAAAAAAVAAAATSTPSSAAPAADGEWAALLASPPPPGMRGLATFLSPLSSRLPAAAASPAASEPLPDLAAHACCLLAILHQVYEDQKLNLLAANTLKPMSCLLAELALALDRTNYADYYARDFPQATACASQPAAPPPLPATPPSCAPPAEPVDLLAWLAASVDVRKPLPPAPCAPMLARSAALVQLFSALGRELRSGKGEQQSPPPTPLPLQMVACGLMLADLDALPLGLAVPLREALLRFRADPPGGWPQAAYTLIGRSDLAAEMLDMNASPQDLTPASGGSAVVPSSTVPPAVRAAASAPLHGDVDDGTAILTEATALRFSSDLRIKEVRRLLSTARPVRIRLQQAPELSDHDFLVEQRARLNVVSQRTFATPVGRAIFTLNTFKPVPTQTAPVAPLAVHGLAFKATIELDETALPPGYMVWPEFHNGVAAGLRLERPGQTSKLGTSWIAYHRPGLDQLSHEHAGFLMALGLLGHITDLATMSIYDYLTKGHETTSLALLLGLAAAKRGTMDAGVSKMLSIHVPALLPASSAEVDVHPMVQTAALMGIGLLYQGTAHRRIAEVLLAEIGRRPAAGLDNNLDRESYSTTAGLALGMVTLGMGTAAAGLADLNLADRLRRYIEGGHVRTARLGGADAITLSNPINMAAGGTGLAGGGSSAASYRIHEGDMINVDITAPGATLALGLMCIRTGNRAVAARLCVPDTQYLLNSLRPDFLLLRVLSRNLILWDDIAPTAEWVRALCPKVVLDFLAREERRQKRQRRPVRIGPDGELTGLDGEEGDGNDEDDELAGAGGSGANTTDTQTLRQAYYNIVAGGCFAVALKYAGTADATATATLMRLASEFAEPLPAALAEEVGRATLETCLDVLVISLAMVQAGTGDLATLRLLRRLHARTTPDVTYGNHMAVHMAIGLLFMGGGLVSLDNSNASVAALIVAFFPRFPRHSADNRYHLQAFRHLWVLAATRSALLTRDVDTGELCYAPVVLKHKGGRELRLVAPCLTPDLGDVAEVCVGLQRYWRVRLDLVAHPGAAAALLQRGTIFVKRKAGRLPYGADAKGMRAVMAGCNTALSAKGPGGGEEEGEEGDAAGGKAEPPPAGRRWQQDSEGGAGAQLIRSLAADPTAQSFAWAMCGVDSAHAREDAVAPVRPGQKDTDFALAVLHDSLAQEKPESQQMYLALARLGGVGEAAAGQLWAADGVGLLLRQLRMLRGYYHGRRAEAGAAATLLDEGFLAAVETAVERRLWADSEDIAGMLRQFAAAKGVEERGRVLAANLRLAAILQFYGIGAGRGWSEVVGGGGDGGGGVEPARLLFRLRKRLPDVSVGALSELVRVVASV